jgi:hypothetical protein
LQWEARDPSGAENQSGLATIAGKPERWKISPVRRKAQIKEAVMTKLAIAVAVLLMGTSASSAQDYCEQVKQGIAQYGYKAARQYAVGHYTTEEVKAADRCVVKLRLRRL